MSGRTAQIISGVVSFAALIVITTVAEFSRLNWAGWLALGLTVLLGLYWAKRGQQRWLLYAVIVLTLFPEAQSSTVAGLELHHILAAVLALTVFIPWVILRPKPLPRLSRLLLVYYIFGGALTAVLLLTDAAPIASMHRLFVTGLFVLISILTPFVIRTKQQLHELFWVLTGAILLSFGIGLAAYYSASISHTLFTNPYIHISTVEGVPRLAATLLDSNFLGHQLLPVVPALLVIMSQVRASLDRTKRIALYSVTVVLTAALLLTYSRSSYIAFGVAVLVLVFFLRKRILRTLLTVAIASAALATVFVPSFPFYSVYRMPSSVLPAPAKEQLLLGFNPRALVDEYIKQIQSDPTLSEEEREQILARDVSSESLGYRIEFWKAGLRMFREHPLTGVGVGQFRYRFAEYSDLSFIQQPDMHNIFLEQLAETGIVGFALLLSVLGLAIWTLRPGLKKREPESIVLLAVLAGLTTQSLLLGGLGALPLYLTIGLIARYSPQTTWFSARPFKRLIGKRSDSRKRIVFITATTKKDGPGNVLHAQIAGLDLKQFEPILITVLKRGGWDADYKKLGVRRINIGLPKPLDVITPFILWKLLWWLRPDLVQTQMIRGDVYGRWAAMRAGVPFISVVHNMDIWKHSGKRFHRFATWFDEQGLIEATRVVAVSEAVKQDVHKQQGIPLSQIEVIRNAVAVSRFSAEPKSSELKKLQSEFKIAEDSQVVLTVARVHQQKAPEVWLMAALKVLKQNPKTTFLWADVGPLFAQMKAAVPPEYHERIKFIGYRKDVPMLLHLADVFVLPSRFEGMPTALLEAMSAGLASVATNVSGNPELITHNKRGLLVPSENPTALARAIIKLLDDAPARSRLGKAAFEFVQTKFTAQRLSREYQALFVELLKL